MQKEDCTPRELVRWIIYNVIIIFIPYIAFCALMYYGFSADEVPAMAWVCFHSTFRIGIMARSTVKDTPYEKCLINSYLVLSVVTFLAGLLVDIYTCFISTRLFVLMTIMLICDFFLTFVIYIYLLNDCCRKREIVYEKQIQEEEDV